MFYKCFAQFKEEFNDEIFIKVEFQEAVKFKMEDQVQVYENIGVVYRFQI